VVSTQLKNISQIGNLPQVGAAIAKENHKKNNLSQPNIYIMLYWMNPSQSCYAVKKYQLMEESKSRAAKQSFHRAPIFPKISSRSALT